MNCIALAERQRQSAPQSKIVSGKACTAHGQKDRDQPHYARGRDGSLVSRRHGASDPGENKMVLAARALSEPHSMCATDLRRCHHEIPASQKREHSDGNVDTSRHSTSPPRDSCFAEQHKAVRLRKIRHGTKQKSLQLTCRHDLAAASCPFRTLQVHQQQQQQQQQINVVAARPDFERR